MSYQNRGVFGHDYGSTLWPTSTWYPAYVDTDGIVHVTTSPTSTIGGIASTVDTDIKTIGGSLIPSGKLPVDATCSTVHATQIGTWDFNLLSPSTLDVDIKTLGGSVIPSGDLPVDADITTYPTADSWSCASTIVGTVSGQILATNTNRKSILIMNHTSGSVLYIGADACCSTASGWPLQYKQSWADGGIGVYTGTICGIAESGSIDVRVIQTV